VRRNELINRLCALTDGTVFVQIGQLVLSVDEVSQLASGNIAIVPDRDELESVLFAAVRAAADDG